MALSSDTPTGPSMSLTRCGETAGIWSLPAHSTKMIPDHTAGFKNLFVNHLVVSVIFVSLHSQTRLRGGAVVARRAHNPKVVGSSPAPATRKAC